MNTLFTRISTVSVVLFICLCSVLQLEAANRTDEYFLLEAKLNRSGMRSMGAVVPIQVGVLADDLYIIFDEPVSQAVVNVRNANLDLIYFDFCINPQVEKISMAGWKSGYYVVEVVTSAGKFVECVYKE